MIGQHALDLKIGIIVESMRSDGIFARDDGSGSGSGIERLIALFEDGQTASGGCGDFVRLLLRHEGEAAWRERVLFSRDLKLNRAVENIQKPLRGGRTEFAAGLTLRGVLSEGRAPSRTDVNNGCSFNHARKHSANKRVRSKQKMIALMRAARLTEVRQRIIHAVNLSLSEIHLILQVAGASGRRSPRRKRRLRARPIRPGRG